MTRTRAPPIDDGGDREFLQQMIDKLSKERIESVTSRKGMRKRLSELNERMEDDEQSLREVADPIDAADYCHEIRAEIQSIIDDIDEIDEAERAIGKKKERKIELLAVFGVAIACIFFYFNH